MQSEPQMSLQTSVERQAEQEMKPVFFALLKRLTALLGSLVGWILRLIHLSYVKACSTMSFWDTSKFSI